MRLEMTKVPYGNALFKDVCSLHYPPLGRSITALSRSWWWHNIPVTRVPHICVLNFASCKRARRTDNMMINRIVAVVVFTTITNCCINAKSLLNADSNSSTPCPEELVKKRVEDQRSWSEFEKAVLDESATGLVDGGVSNSEEITTTNGPAKILIYSSDNAQKDETTTLCPKELAKLKRGTEKERRKRQSSYYPFQDHNQSPEAIRPKSMNQPRGPQTYHQLQRHYPSKSQYQNYKQPVKGYQNPSVYVRYPSNGNFKGNYYKVQRRGGSNAGNRRQYKGRPVSTTVKSTRATIKKKFRPSPVFV